MTNFKRRAAYFDLITLLILFTIVGSPSHIRAQDEPAGEQPLSLLIRGIVVDESGEPVAGASIQSLTLNKDNQRQTVSLRNGAFVLRIPAEGHYAQSVLATDATGERAGYISQYDYTTDARAPLKIVLRPWKSTTLTVVDSEQQPVVDASVVLIVSYQELMKAETDQEGKVSLRFPADAKVDWIIAYKAGRGFDYYENYNAWPTQDRLQVPERVELKLLGAVSAIIEVRDSDNNPVPNVRVAPWTIETEGKITYANMSGLGTQRTDENGQALFDWLPSNLKKRIAFLVRDEKYYCATNPIYELNTEEVVTCIARVQRVATVRGTVRHADGSPASGIRLQGEGRGATNMYFRGYTRTDAQGRYSIDIYPEQETILGVTDDRYAAESKTGIDLKPGKELNDVDFTLGFGTLIHGKLTVGSVVNSQGEPQAKRRVVLHMSVTDLGKAHFNFVAETDANGNFSFPAVAVGMQGGVSVSSLLGAGQTVEFKMTQAEDLQLSPIVDDSK